MARVVAQLRAAFSKGALSQSSSVLNAVGAALALYSMVLWTWLRPDFIREWREADTLTIARHLTEPGASILLPRIDWGGAGLGYVEAEFQLYTWLTSLLLRVFGDGEWPGQLISLLAVVLAGILVFSELRRRYGVVAASLGTAALLASRGVVQCATSMQPDALCLFLFVAAWCSLLDYTRSQSRRSLVIYTIAGAAAMLTKPTAAQLGIASFLLLLVQFRPLLRRWELWCAWAAMLAAFALHMVYARNVYLEYGNTFGVLSGDNQKLPRLDQLFAPGLYFNAAYRSMVWGIGPVGALALVVSLVRGKHRAPIVALLVGTAVWTLLAIRCTTSPGFNHYHLLGSVLAAYTVADASAALRRSWPRYSQALLACMLLAQLGDSMRTRARLRHSMYDESAIAAARALERHARPGTLIAARSINPRYDANWKTNTTFEDPRVFFLSKTRGWPIEKELADPARLIQARQEGARYYVELEARPAMPDFDAWLAKNATLVETTLYGGSVYDLTTAPGS